MQVTRVLTIGLLGSFGVFLRYLISLIASSSVAITFCNLVGTFLIAKTANFENKKKDYFHTGFLGGFTSLSAIIILNNHNILALIINIILAVFLYHKTYKNALKNHKK